MPRDSVVLAWEASGDEDDRTRLAALDALATVAATSDAAILLPIDVYSERLFPRIVEVLTRHRVAALPVVAIDSRSDKGRPYATREAVPMLRALAAAGAVAEWGGERFLGIAADESFVFDDAHAPLCKALGAPGRTVHVGWVRRHSARTPLPQGFNFVFDWLPYGAPVAAGVAPQEYDYAIVATEIARLKAGDSPVSPSVLWSFAPSIVLPHVATRLTGVAPLKVVYAIDSARRFVRNRAGYGVPFWVLRAAFDPDAPAEVAALAAMPAVLAGRHAASYSPAHAGRVELPAQSRARIAAVVHLYFPELWNELADAIAVLPEPCDVFVSCPMRARDAIERLVRTRFPDAVVFGIHNLGRDVLPFLHWLAAAGADRYDYVLKLHSKKSVHVVDANESPLGGGEGWRRQALGGLVGERSHVAALLRALDANPDVGIVAPTNLLYDQVEWRCATRDLLAALCEGYAIDGSTTEGFAAGAMFWARPAALAPLAHAPAHLLDFECEAGQVDSTLHHAYERLFPLVAAAQGYRTVDAAQLEEFARQRAA